MNVLLLSVMAFVPLPKVKSGAAKPMPIRAAADLTSQSLHQRKVSSSFYEILNAVASR
jgi:hypothetical protein